MSVGACVLASACAYACGCVFVVRVHGGVLCSHSFWHVGAYACEDKIIPLLK